MSRYRRATTGSTFFFTVVTYRRRPILCDPPVREALRRAIEKARILRPFTIDAMVLLPDHLHCIWTLPEHDYKFSARWSTIKRMVSIACCASYRDLSLLTPSKTSHRESTIWQRRFWEHRLRNDADFKAHMDYVHYNPVRHGHAATPAQWPYSSFHRHVRDGVYRADWCVGPAARPSGADSRSQRLSLE